MSDTAVTEPAAPPAESPLPGLIHNIAWLDDLTRDARVLVLGAEMCQREIDPTRRAALMEEITEGIRSGTVEAWKTTHLSVCVSGVLRRSDRELGRLFTDDGKRRPGSMVRDWLKLQEAKGVKVLPCGESCPDFHPVDGCPGHWELRGLASQAAAAAANG